MDSAPERRSRDGAADRPSGDLWRTRGGLALVVALTLCSVAVWIGLVGRGAGAAAGALSGPGAHEAAREASPTATAGAAVTQAAPAMSTQAPAVPSVPAGQPTAEPAVQTTPQSSPTSAPQQTPQQMPQVTPSPAVATQRREHTVAAGDTLFAIAQRYGTTVDALVAANRLPNRNATLQIGQRLVVPG